MRAVGSPQTVAKPIAKATAKISRNEPFFGSSAPMKLPIGTIPVSTPASSSAMRAIMSSDPARN